MIPPEGIRALELRTTKLVDVYLYMLASWHPGDSTELYRRLPKLGTHAKIISARPAVAQVEADHTRNNALA